MFLKKYIKVLFTLVSLSLISGILVQCRVENQRTISLEGEWQVRLDSLDTGIKDQWASEKFNNTGIQLPGTLDDAGLGPANPLKPAMNNYVLSHLARKHQYIGPAWYQREVTIPPEWEDKVIELKLERVLWESRLYVDGKKAGMQESLISPHCYDLTGELTPGKHTLTLRIDNSEKYPLINVHGSMYPDPYGKDMAHGYTNHTQIKWNGVIGELSLTARERIYPEDAQVFPASENDRLSVRLTLGNGGQSGWSGKVNYSIQDSEGKEVISGSEQVSTGNGEAVQFDIGTDHKLALWDEFHPVLYTLRVTLESANGTSLPLDTRFGVRTVDNENGVLTLNGKRIFLRGNLSCAIFPLTGYPYTEKKDWAELIETAKSYGLNHLRFHSWCPPEAAFAAADEAGFYFQVEPPHWSSDVGKDPATTAFLQSEVERMLTAYGNHPSFILMSLGNELKGDVDLMNRMVRQLKEKDGRHLYATTSFSFQRGMGKYPQPQDEFLITQYTDKGWVRGQGIFNSHPPHFNEDYSEVIDSIKVPIISHEIGQYSVFPDMSEIEKYTGVLKPLNFIAVRNDLEKKGLLDLAGAFTQASGKLAAMLYKEEIERALKTEGFDGFQLLQLQDFPGQGTALVGLLNAFWESKGVISGEEFRQFCSEVVPLISFEKAVYTSGETFEAEIEIANFYKEIENATLEWKISGEEGTVLAGGELKDLQLSAGNNQGLGTITFPVQTDTARRLTVSLSLKDTPYRNSWPVWVYPGDVTVSKEGILITSSFAEAKTALDQGKKVLLNPMTESLAGIQGRFVPVFWSPVHFPDQPGTMGILCDPEHPALQAFPTRSHTEWQWWDLCINSKSVVIDSLRVKPLVRVIDNFVTNHHLANLFEAKVGEGKLLFSSIDLKNDLEKRPVARQLLHSLLRYMDSGEFNPREEVSFEDLTDQLQEKAVL